MAQTSNTDSAITRLARKVGHVAGKIALTTQGLAASAAAIVHSESAGDPAAEASPSSQAHDSRTPRSAPRAEKKKSKFSPDLRSTNKAGPTNKKTKTNKKKTPKKSGATKSRKRHSKAPRPILP